MAVMNCRELIQKMLAGAAVVAVGVTVMPHVIEAAPLSVGRTLPSEATDEFVHKCGAVTGAVTGAAIGAVTIAAVGVVVAAVGRVGGAGDGGFAPGAGTEHSRLTEV